MKHCVYTDAAITRRLDSYKLVTVPLEWIWLVSQRDEHEWYATDNVTVHSTLQHSVCVPWVHYPLVTVLLRVPLTHMRHNV